MERVSKNFIVLALFFDALSHGVVAGDATFDGVMTTRGGINFLMENCLFVCFFFVLIGYELQQAIIAIQQAQWKIIYPCILLYKE